MPTWNVAPELFERQLASLLADGYRPTRLSELIEAAREGSSLGPKRFAITFDDGYASVLTYALPILKRLQVPATVLLVTACLDRSSPFPADDWCGAGRDEVPDDFWRTLSTRECDVLLESGLIDLGSHSHTHVDFRRKPALLRRDLAESVERLEQRFGISQPPFSYPYGSVRHGFCAPPLVQAVRDSGLMCGLTFEPVAIQASSDRYTWGRIPVSALDTPTMLAAKLSGWYGVLRTAWRQITSSVRPSGPSPYFPPLNWWQAEQEMSVR
jgi:peptidoglycan/xylan/chitin deacetylase (PgdA/CDA1 family)